jgi:hypothetical protein
LTQTATLRKLQITVKEPAMNANRIEQTSGASSGVDFTFISTRQNEYFSRGWYWYDEHCDEPMGPFATVEEARADYNELRSPSSGLIAAKCPTCGGHGADPMSDNTNWLPCSTCNGTGAALLSSSDGSAKR